MPDTLSTCHHHAFVLVNSGDRDDQDDDYDAGHDMRGTEAS